MRTANICPAIYFSNQQTIYIFLVLFTLMFIYLGFFIAHALYYIIKLTIAIGFDIDILVIFMCFIDQPLYAQPEKTKTRKGKLTRYIRSFV